MKVNELMNILSQFDENAEVTINHSYTEDKSYNSDFYTISQDGFDQCGGEVYIRIEKR